MARLECGIDVQANAQLAFEYLADYRNAKEYIPIATSVVPTGDKAAGLGSEFWCDGRAKIIRVGLGFRVNDFVPHRKVGFELLVLRVSVLGDKPLAVEASGSVEFVPLLDGLAGTRLNFLAFYEWPRSIIVRTLAKQFGVEKELERGVRDALLEIKRRLEFEVKPRLQQGLASGNPLGAPLT